MDVRDRGHIKIRHLSDEEITQLDSDLLFSLLKPVKCEKCGSKGPFSRKLCQITGTLDDFSRYVIWDTMKTNYNTEHFIFKRHNKRTYLEAAWCPDCASTKIVFDIDAETFRQSNKEMYKWLEENMKINKL